MNPDTPKIVEVFWVDAETIGDTGWIGLTEAMESARIAPPVMRSVGFLLIDHEDYIAITDAIGDKECGHVTKIPINMIKRRTNLLEEDTLGDMG